LNLKLIVMVHREFQRDGEVGLDRRLEHRLGRVVVGAAGAGKAIRAASVRERLRRKRTVSCATAS
jgi:hypothetical protein